jgi:hypothetical protein
MRLILTALIFVGGLAYLVIGLGFIALPANLIGGFGLDPQGAAGLSTTRADFTAFFVVSGLSMLYGGWKRSGEILLVPAFLFGIALLGRTVSAIVDGTYDGFLGPMAIEALTTLVCLTGWRVLPHEPPSSEF